MANLKEVRNRIASVKGTQQITKAMKLVSGAKLKKAQDSIVSMRPYASKLSNMLANLVAATEGDVEIDLAKEREVAKVLIILITSDRGLCGSFNSNLIKETQGLLENKYASQAAAGNVRLLTIGKKGFDKFKKTNDVNDAYVGLFADLNFEAGASVAEKAIQSYIDGDYDVVEVVFGQFKNAAVQIPTVVQFLPVEKIVGTKGDDASESSFNSDYIFEPNKITLIQELVPKILKTKFYRYLIDNSASEHGARMTAMEKATENAGEMLNDLKLSYNKARQAAITTELTEIASGAAALQG